MQVALNIVMKNLQAKARVQKSGIKPRKLSRAGPGVQPDEGKRKTRRESLRFALPSMAAIGLLGGCGSSGGTSPGVDGPSPGGVSTLDPLVHKATGGRDAGLRGTR